MESCSPAPILIGSLLPLYFFKALPPEVFLSLLLQVRLPTLYQHTRSRRSCSSLWARSQCLESTQRCPLQARGKFLSDGSNYQLLLLCNMSVGLVNKAAAGKTWTCYFLFLCNLSFDLCPLGSAPRPEGTRMIQVMLLKSLVQVRVQGCNSHI